MKDFQALVLEMVEGDTREWLRSSYKVRLLRMRDRYRTPALHPTTTRLRPTKIICNFIRHYIFITLEKHSFICGHLAIGEFTLVLERDTHYLNTFFFAHACGNCAGGWWE